MFRKLFTVSILSLICLGITVVLAQAQSQLELNIQNYCDSIKDEEQFIEDVNDLFNIEKYNLNKFLNEKVVWDLLEKDWKVNNPDEYKKIMDYFNSKKDDSGVAILVNKIVPKEKLSELDQQREDLENSITQLAVKGINIENIINRKIEQIDRDIREKIQDKLKDCSNINDVLNLWDIVSKGNKNIYAITGDIFANKYMDFLSKTATTSQCLDAWQVIKEKIPPNLPEESRKQITDAIVGKVSSSIQNELKEQNVEKILEKWNELTNSDAYKADSSKEFDDVLKKAVNENLKAQFPKDLENRSSNDQFKYWTDLKNELNQIADESTMAFCQKKLDEHMCAAFTSELKGNKTNEIIQKWGEKEQNSNLMNSIKESLKKIAQSQLDESFKTELSDVDPSFAKYIAFQSKQEKIGTFNLASDPSHLKSLICNHILSCFKNDWGHISPPSYAKYKDFLDQITSKIKVNDLKAQKAVISDSFAKAWEDELLKKTPKEIVSFWKSAENLPYFEILPKEEMLQRTEKRLVDCVNEKLSAITECQACSDYWESLTGIIEKLKLDTSKETINQATEKRFNEITDSTYKEDNLKNLDELKSLKTKVASPFKEILGNKIAGITSRLNEKYLAWWKGQLINSNCVEILKKWKNYEDEFKTKQVWTQLKEAYEIALSERFNSELDAKRQTCSTLITFWKELINNGFTPTKDQNNQIILAFTNTLNAETPSDLEDAKGFLENLIQSFQENSIFSPVLNAKLDMITKSLGEQEEYRQCLANLTSNLDETPNGLEEIEKRIKELEEKFPQFNFNTYKKLHQENQNNLEDINTIFIWNKICDKRSLTQEELQTDIQLIPEWQKYTSESNMYNFTINDVNLKRDLHNFFVSTRSPHWSEYMYKDNHYYITPKQVLDKRFGILDDDTGYYLMTVNIDNPSLVREAYHHHFFETLDNELMGLLDSEIQKNPMVLYHFILKALNAMKADKNLHPAYAAYGMCKILMILQDYSAQNKYIETAFCISQNRQLVRDFDSNFISNRFEMFTFFKRKDRRNAFIFIQNCPIPRNLASVATPNFTPYRWVGFVDSKGNYHLIDKENVDVKNLLILKDKKLVSATKKNVGKLLFSHSIAEKR